MPPSPFRGCEWNAQEELRTTAQLRLYVDAAVVKLKNAVGHCEADAAAAALGGEVEVEDFFANFGRDTDAVVGDAEDCHSAFFFEDDAEIAAIGHGLRGIERDVEDVLLEQVGVDVDDHGSG